MWSRASWGDRGSIVWAGKGGRMKIDLVVFDMAGTTVNDDDSVNRCLRAALAAAGLSVTAAQVNAVMGLPKPSAIAILIDGSAMKNELGDQIEKIHNDFVARSIDFYRRDPSVYEVPGTKRVFETLKRSGIRVALDTGFNRAITQVILDRLGWAQSPLIDATICSDEVPQGRPHPDMIQALMARLAVDDVRTVVKVGDTPADLQEGERAGCGLVVGVTHGTHSRTELEAYYHTNLIETIADLPGLLGLDAG
jgi:phosphonatase-like hydrolase